MEDNLFQVVPLENSRSNRMFALSLFVCLVRAQSLNLSLGALVLPDENF